MTQPLLPVVKEDFAQARSVLLHFSTPANKRLFLERSEEFLYEQDPILHAFMLTIADSADDALVEKQVMATSSDAYWLLHTQSKLDRHPLPKVTPERVKAALQDLYRSTKGPASNVRRFLHERNKLFLNENPALAEYVIDSAARLEKRDHQIQVAHAAGLEYWVLRSQAEADQLKEAYECGR